MDLGIILSTIIAFIKLWIPLAVIAFVLSKVFSLLRKKFADKYNFSWIKSVLLINFVIIFVVLLATYLYFMFAGASVAPIRDPELEFDLIENALFVLLAALRIGLSAIILTFVLTLFEMIASFTTDSISGSAKHRSKKKPSVSPFHQFAGVLISIAVFLLLFLFVFDWVPLGLFVFIFYGKVAELPLLLAFV